MMDRRLWLLLGVIGTSLPADAPPADSSADTPYRSHRSLWHSHRDHFHHHGEWSTRPSHRSLDDDIANPGNLEEILNGRLLKAGEKGDLQQIQKLLDNQDLLKQLAKGRLSPGQLQFLKDNSGKIRELLKDPRGRSLIEKAIANQSERKTLSEQQIDALKKLAESKFDPSSLPPVTNSTPTPEDSPKPSESQENEQSTSESPADSSALSSSDDEEETWFDRLASSFLANPENVEMFQESFRSLGGLRVEADGSERFDLGGLWKGAAGDISSWMPSGLPSTTGIFDNAGSFFHLLRETLPEFGHAVNVALPRSLGERSTSSGVGGEEFIWVLIVAGMAIVVWKLSFSQAAKRSANTTTISEAWPVAPSAVANRDDLIQAFEHLAIVRLGVTARTSNHLEIASRLCEEKVDSAHCAAAGELARLYEQARYEPGLIPLDEADLANARRDLALLAGVAVV